MGTSSTIKNLFQEQNPTLQNDAQTYLDLRTLSMGLFQINFTEHHSKILVKSVMSDNQTLHDNLKIPFMRDKIHRVKSLRDFK